jgi:hypothetical protein
MKSLRNCLKTQDFAHETYEIDEKEEEIFLKLTSFSFLSRVSWAEKYFSNSFLARLYPFFENHLKADLSDFISVEILSLRVFKHRFFSSMFENSLPNQTTQVFY